jgi:hypothetical protein
MARGSSRSQSELNVNSGRFNALMERILPRNPAFDINPDFQSLMRKKEYRDKNAEEIDKEQTPLVDRVNALPPKQKKDVLARMEKLRELVEEHISRHPAELEDASRGSKAEIEKANSLKQQIAENIEKLPAWVKKTLYEPKDKISQLTRGADKPTLTEVGDNIASFTDDPLAAAAFGQSQASFGVQRFYTEKDIESFGKIIDIQKVGRLAFKFHPEAGKNEGIKFIYNVMKEEREYLVTGIKWKKSTLEEKIGTDTNPVRD